MRPDPKRPVAAVSYAGWRNLKNTDTMACVRKIKRELQARRRAKRTKRRQLFDRHRRSDL